MLRLIGVMFISLLLVHAPINAADGATGAYPNPFVHTCTFTLKVPVPGSNVRIAIYDLLGRQVRVLIPVDGTEEPQFYPAGEYLVDWDGNDFAGREVIPNVYICVLSTDVGVTRIVKVVKGGWR